MTTIASRASSAKPRRVVYPTQGWETDGRNRQAPPPDAYVLDALEVYYAARPDVYVSGNNFVFWEEGNPKARVSPDGYVVFGIPQRERDSYIGLEGERAAPRRYLRVHLPQDARRNPTRNCPFEQVLRST